MWFIHTHTHTHTHAHTHICAGPFVSAGEVVSLLIQAGFFDMAIQVSECFKLPLALVFEALAARYLVVN